MCIANYFVMLFRFVYIQKKVLYKTGTGFQPSTAPAI